jgi:hypothetical protein
VRIREPGRRWFAPPCASAVVCHQKERSSTRDRADRAPAHDDAAHRAVLKAVGREQRGRGAATALVTSRMEAVDGGTKVFIATDLSISGAAAQYGRGMLGDISQRMTDEFARCLEERIAASAEPAPAFSPAAPVPATAGAPVKGVRLGVWAFWRAVMRFFRRLFGRRPA